MGVGKYLLVIASFASLLYASNGCSMDGVGNWLLTQDHEILDVDRGTFWNRSTTNIQAITGTASGGSVNFASYLDIQLDLAGFFTISTSDGFALYEENETSEYISFTVTFSCVGGSSNSLIFSVRVQDTNNNPPTFRPSDQYEFVITPPLPPGFQIPGDDIIVRDIDLTTSRIDFTIEDNDYFEIVYEGRSSTDQKEFIASLRTKDLIRSLSQDLELTISATDVDATSDPPITTYATITVKADESFVFPEEPVFAQPFYLATYTNNQVVLEQTISLSQGFDDEVTFSLEGEYSDYFDLVRDENIISIRVTRALSNEILRTGHIILVVRAEREYTSGATATVIVQVPEVPALEFEQTQYEGRIVDNVLETLQLTLIQGYEEGFNINIQNEYASYFSTSIQGNVVTLQMTPLETNIINENNFINLQVVASNEYSSATTVIILDIIKDDNLSPVFEKAIYMGEYDSNTGLSVELITLAQGYDETVSFTLAGEQSAYFSIDNVGPVITLQSSGIPTEIWAQQQLLLTIAAEKPRSVTATTAVSIQLPSARELAFEELTYTGTLQDNTLTLRTIVLSVGYSEDVNFTLDGDYSSYFTLSPAQNGVTINLSAAVPDNVITENNFLTLVVSASGLHAVPTSAAVLLEIMKQDLSTPVFTENIYAGYYLGENSIEIGNISLAQGYDSTVTFRLEGEHAQYFQITNNAYNVNLVLSSNIPPEVIFSEKVLLFSILAEKALSVGANAAVSITFPEELTDATVMRFSQNTYVGTLEDNLLTVENIVLEIGYENDTILSLFGDYASYFQIQNERNVINILVQNQLSEEIIENNEFIIIEIEASRERAVSAVASIVIDIKKEEIVPPVFSNAYYKTVYADEILQDLTITLSEGYDDTVTFNLQGDSSVWFSITNTGNTAYLALNTSTDGIPVDILTNNDYFLFSVVADKPNTASATAAIFVHLPKETPETVLLQFSQTSYVGRIENGELYAPAILLVGEKEPIEFHITGDYAEYFEVIQASSTNVQIQLNLPLPENIEELPFIIIDIEAHYPEAISGHTTVILEVVKEPEIVTPVFEQAYYIGEYSGQGGLQFEHSIQLSQGFDESVVFTLAGDDAQWFELNNVAENSFTLVLSETNLGQIRDRSHLVFSVVANKIGNISGYSAIIINFSDLITTIPLRFAQNFYLGSIEDNALNVANMTIEEGYSSDLNITFTGDHMEYFQLTNQNGVFTLQLLSNLPADVIDDNNVLVFTLEAQFEESRTHATIVLELIKTELSAIAFEEAYYVGSYSIISGFTFDPRISLSEGYDETVSFSLEGDSSQWFDIVENQYPLELTQTNPIPNEIVSNHQPLIFVIVAENSVNSSARSTVIVSIIYDTILLEFERNVYLGTIQENDLTTDIDTIILTEGYSENITFSLLGDLGTYFTIEREESSVTIKLETVIPNELLPTNGIILLELQASAPQAISAYATIVLGIVRDKATPLQFDETYYTGRYSESEGLSSQIITLAEGNDETVQFSLDGDDSQYFEIIETENVISLRLVTTIPTELIVNHRPLIFTIRAERSDGENAQATIVITLINETVITILQFEHTSYLGSIENNAIDLNTITLSEGYHQNVTFTLDGALDSYFSVSNAEAIVAVALNNEIPEDLIPENGIVILELQASAPNAVSAFTTIVFTVVREEIVVEHPFFSSSYYAGHYTESEGLTFDERIELVEGYDETVEFHLKGDDSQYFEIVETENVVSLRLVTTIPTELVVNHRPLIFTIHAERSDGESARATVVITLINESVITILQFEHTSYLGSIENNAIDLNTITLSEGYHQNVTFTLDGALDSYFSVSNAEAIVAVALDNEIPEDLIPENGIVILELQASAPNAVSAFTTIVFAVVRQEIVVEHPFFSSNYYAGHYTESEGLTFDERIELVEGYDETVEFHLEGDDSQYFEIVETENVVSLRLVTTIPTELVVNHRPLIFTIHAERSDGESTRATVVITLIHESVITILQFEHTSYLGSIENNAIDLNTITLSEGYHHNVTFTLDGALDSYFSVSNAEAIVAVALDNEIPEDLIPENGIVILELQASAPNAVSAFTTIVFAVVRQEIVVEHPFFSSNYYAGHYTESEGLTFDERIELVEGYDETVEFHLEGDDSQYFEAIVTENFVTLREIIPIPTEIITNNQQLIFSIRADKSNATSAYATIVVSLISDPTYTAILSFDRISYLGLLENNILNLGSIRLINEENVENITYVLNGDLSSYFTTTETGGVITTILVESIPENSIPENNLIILELQASAPQTVSAYAALVIDVVRADNNDNLEQLIFSETYYTGHYTEADGLLFTNTITLAQGYDQNVTFTLEGDGSQYFSVITQSENAATVEITSPIPSAVVMSNHHLVFTIRAERPGTVTGRATIVIALLDEYTENMGLLGFDRITYTGSLDGDDLVVDQITVSEGYSENVTVRLLGDLNIYFAVYLDGAIVTITLNNQIPEESMSDNRIILLELEAMAPNTLSARAAIVIEVVQGENLPLIEQLVFSNTLYTGLYNEVEGLTFEDNISLTEGYDNNVTFILEGDDSQYFELIVVSENSKSLRQSTPIPSAIVANNRQLIFTIIASKPNAHSARAPIVIFLNDEYTETTPALGFNRISYVGSIEDNLINVETIVLSEGYSRDVGFTLHGDLQSYFALTINEATVTISVVSDIPEEEIPANNFIVLDIQASAPDTISAHATIILEVIQENVDEIAFTESYYTGEYSVADGLTFDATISLSQGYDDTVAFSLEGDHAQWFMLTRSEEAVTINLVNSIPEDVLESNRKLIFFIVAQKSEISTRAIIVISLVDGAVCSDVWFEKILFEGTVQQGEVLHETITVFGYDGTDIELHGVHAALFSASLSEGVVTVRGLGSVTLTPDVSYVALELRAGTASAVLLLDIEHSNENPDLPTVTFDSSSYILSTDVTYTGRIGLVRATTDTGEAVAYSLSVDNTHLLERIGVTSDGELILWAPANSGVYSFDVRATTVRSNVTASVPVHLTVEYITVSGSGDYMLPPLHILNRDEESPHMNLVPFNASEFEGCRYVMSNHWPAEQSWLYVDDTGLHTNAIDREHESIAFMALSQVQVELVLQCDSDSESKRSVNSGLRTDQLEHLGPYDYGNSRWIITDSINYNPRRSLVNLIVNDINDNYPIFIGKEDEPIVVGYPVSDLEERILPRALIEVQATDADVGENAALVYWSSEEILAVSPTTGSVHVRDIAGLQNDMVLTVSATDRNGQGLTGSLDILVKLIDTSHIAVVTVKDAFLDDEQNILSKFTAALGYEVKALKASVISDTKNDEVEANSRNNRDAVLSSGGLLQLYVYGLIEREPVSVERLSGDITASIIETVIIASTVSLEDHLESLMICPLLGRDTALFVSTIVLAVLLFILIVAAAVWFLLIWWRKENYEEFSDESSLDTPNETVTPINGSKLEQPTPRINIEDLKRSERRLQEMLAVDVEPRPSPQPALPLQPPVEKPVESKVSIPELPMVIQSFDKLKDADGSDDEDEFGERKKNRRKSVVTFNENVEKIIHVEEPPDDSEFEVFRL